MLNRCWMSRSTIASRLPRKPSKASWCLPIGNSERLFRCFRVLCGRRQEEANQRWQQALASPADIVNELEEAEVERQLFLGDPPVGAKPGAQQGPEALDRIDVDLVEPISIVISGILPDGMADGLVLVTPVAKATVDHIFIRVDQRAHLNHRAQDWFDGLSLNIWKHEDGHFTGPLDDP